MSDPDRVRHGRQSSAAGRMGWISVVLGGFVLLAGYQLPPESLVATLAVALRPLAWLALGLGLIVVAVRRLRRGDPEIEDDDVPASSEEEPQPGVTRPSVLQALGISRGTPAPEIEPRFVDTIAVYPPSPEDGSPPERETSWSPRVLDQIDWRHFEAMCQAFFTQAGFATSAQSQGDQGGVDIWVQSRHMPAPRIVRCRHWEGQPVNVKEVRDFLGVMSAQGLEHGTYVTSSTFAPDASEFAKANGIQTQDGAQLLKLISHRTPQEQKALLDIAYGEDPGKGVA